MKEMVFIFVMTKLAFKVFEILYYIMTSVKDKYLTIETMFINQRQIASKKKKMNLYHLTNFCALIES